MDPATAAYVAWTEHRFFKYRGCAPDPDNPRLAVGTVDVDGRPVQLSVDAWHGPDKDGGETKQAREARVQAAKDVCLNCPVMVQCDVYARLAPAQADGVRGGRTVRERGALVKAPKRRVPVAVPVDHLRTPQKLAVLRVLAGCADEYRVAMETGLGVRKANWQRARLTSGLGLEPTASRNELLKAAVDRGLLDASLVVVDDGKVPAIPAATRKLLIEVDGQFLLWPSDPAEVKDTAPVRRSSSRGGERSAPVSLRAKFRRVQGQEAFDVPVTVPAEWADVHDLFAAPAKTLEAVA